MICLPSTSRLLHQRLQPFGISEDAELADVIDALGNPDALTLGQLIDHTAEIGAAAADWLMERKNRRAIPHRMERCDYVPVRNPDRAANSSGLWIVGKQRQMIYALASLDPDVQIAAAQQLKKEEDEFYEKNKRYEDCD